MKSFKPKDDPGGDGPDAGRNAERDFRGQKRSNETHASTTDPDARLYKKAEGQPSRLCFVGTALMENRNGLVVDGRLTRASGVSECLAAIDLADAHIRRGRHARRRQRLRHRRLRRRTPRSADHPARRSERLRHRQGQASVQYRRAHDPARRLRRQPEMPQAHRGDLRLAEDRRRLAQDRGSEASSAPGHGFHLALAAYNLARMPKLLVAEGG